MVDTVIVAPGANRERQPVVSWTAIFAGWLVALGFAWLFYVTGIAVGFSAFDLNASEAVAKGIGIGTTIWVILTWAVSLFLGGMFASWVDARPDPTIGALHGVAVWVLRTSSRAPRACCEPLPQRGRQPLPPERPQRHQLHARPVCSVRS